MGEMVIRVDGRAIERVIYWLIIIVLVGLLIWSFARNCAPEENTVAIQEQDTTTNTPEEDPIAPVIEDELPAADETCSDGIENQDETNVDCGGVCTSINGGYFYNGECHQEEESKLSGLLDFSVTDIETQEADSGAFKVTSFKVVVDNGKPNDLFVSVEAFAESTSGVLLNQFSSDEQPYMGPLDLGRIDSGAKRTFTVDESGSYVFEQTGYTLGNDIKLVVYFYDDDGEKLDTVTKNVGP